MITQEQLVEIAKSLEIELGEETQFVLFIAQKEPHGPGTMLAGAGSIADRTAHTLVHWINDVYIKNIPLGAPHTPGWSTKIVS